jgi:glycyl-tRNA synthetase beta subunit
LSLGSLLGDDAPLAEFVLDRVRYYFREIRGFGYDEVNAVLAAGHDDLVDVEARRVFLDRRFFGDRHEFIGEN